MRYWAYIDNQVRGPFDKDKLAAQPGFKPVWLVCREGDQSGGWKPASSFPEIMQASAPPAAAPAPATKADTPLAMTMRGTLIGEPPADAEPSASGPVPTAESPLALTMRGSLVSEPLNDDPPPAAAPKPGASPADPERAALRAKIGELEGLLKELSAAQAGMAARLASAEKAAAALREMLK